MNFYQSFLNMWRSQKSMLAPRLSPYKKLWLTGLLRWRLPAVLFIFSLFCFMPFFYSGRTIGGFDIQPFPIRLVMGLGSLSLLLSFCFTALLLLPPKKTPVPFAENESVNTKSRAIWAQFFVAFVWTCVVAIFYSAIGYYQSYHREKVEVLQASHSSQNGKKLEITKTFKVHRKEIYNFEITQTLSALSSPPSLTDASLSSSHTNQIPAVIVAAPSSVAKMNALCEKESMPTSNHKILSTLNPLPKNCAAMGQALGFELEVRQKTKNDESALLAKINSSEPLSPDTIIEKRFRRLLSVELEPGKSYTYRLKITPMLAAPTHSYHFVVEPSYQTQRKNTATQWWYRAYFYLCCSLTAIFFWVACWVDVCQTKKGK